MQNKKEEIKIAIESKMTDIGKLIDEYESMGGKVTNATLLRYDDEEQHHMALNGTGKDIGDLLFSNEHISTIIEGYTFLGMVDDIIKGEEK